MDPWNSLEYRPGTPLSPFWPGGPWLPITLLGSPASPLSPTAPGKPAEPYPSGPVELFRIKRKAEMFLHVTVNAKIHVQSMWIYKIHKSVVAH